MTRRDLAWRGAGGALIAMGLAAIVCTRSGVYPWHAVLAISGLVATFAGLVLLDQGKRVASAFRIERGRHRLLPTAIHARRRIRHRRP